MSKDILLSDAEERMNKAIATLEKEFTKLRTGRASTSLVDNIKVDYYGTITPIQQMASIAIPDSRTVTIQPWDKSAMTLIEKAIVVADLGLTPQNDGNFIRINIPPLTEERRKDMSKVCKKYTEEAKIAIRNVRRDANENLKKLEKDKVISEDELKKAMDDIQKTTDSFVAKSDAKNQAKEKEIMEI